MTTTTNKLNAYNAIIRWANHYGTSKVFGGTLTDGKAIYASNKMFNHYVTMAQTLK